MATTPSVSSTTPCVVRASALIATVCQVTHNLFKSLGPPNHHKRKTFALDLCALLDFSNQTTPHDVACLRPAVMIDYAPGMTSGGACLILNHLSGVLCEPDWFGLNHLEVFEVHGVVLVANVFRLCEVLSSFHFNEDDEKARAPRFIDVLPNSVTPLSEEKVWHAMAHLSREIKAGLNHVNEITKSRDYGKCPRAPFDLVAALGVGAEFVPPPTLVGVCLGYPRVYAWFHVDDAIGEAQRALSTTDLELFEVYATCDATADANATSNADNQSAKQVATKHRVCGFTTPRRSEFGELSKTQTDESLTRPGDIQTWFHAMQKNAVRWGQVWRDLTLVATRRDAGPVAL